MTSCYNFGFFSQTKTKCHQRAKKGGINLKIIIAFVSTIDALKQKQLLPLWEVS